MTTDRHPDPAQHIRFALWGVLDEETAAVERHLVDDACRSCGQATARYRQLRGEFGDYAECEPSAEVVERARRAVAEAAPAYEPAWLDASPVRELAGVRAGEGDDMQVVCSLGDVELRAMLHATGAPYTYGVTGQLLVGGSEPVTDVPVVLLIDRAETAEAETDPFGEFTFDVVRGKSFGVRVGIGPDALHVKLWEHAA